MLIIILIYLIPPLFFLLLYDHLVLAYSAFFFKEIHPLSVKAGTSVAPIFHQKAGGVYHHLFMCCMCSAFKAKH